MPEPKTNKRNALFILLDAFRWDTFASIEHGEAFAPNIARLARDGWRGKVVSNGQTTRFAFPALFSQSFPLDHGGYNFGIRGRPLSVIEVLKQQGYYTDLTFGADLDGPLLGFDRGSDRARAMYDKRLQLAIVLRNYLHYEVRLWKQGVHGDTEIQEILQRDFDSLLAYLAGSLNRVDDPRLHPRMRTFSRREAEAISAERALLKRDWRAVCEKILAMPDHHYFHYLGKERAGFGLFFRKKSEGILSRLQTFLNNRCRITWNFLRLNLQIIAREVCDQGVDAIMAANTPWFVFIHVEDLHDFKVFSRPVELFRRLRYVPACVRARRRFPSRRPFRYDLALMDVDRHVGRIINSAEESGRAPLIFVTGDHGYGWENDRAPDIESGDTDLSIWDGTNDADGAFGYRTHHEHIEVPLIIYGGRDVARADVTDSMGISATLLSELGIAIPDVFKGTPVDAFARDTFVSECAGRGNADVNKRDLFFTVTGPARKIMTRLTNCHLRIDQVYDLSADPRELRNLVAGPDVLEECAPLLDALFRERRELFELRGVNRENVVIGAEMIASTGARA